MNRPYIVKVPMTVEAESPAAAIATAEKLYGGKPKKATEAPWASWPASIRSAAAKSGIPERDPLWCDHEGQRWVCDGYCGVAVGLPAAVPMEGAPHEGVAECLRSLSLVAESPVKRFRHHVEIGNVCVKIEFIRFVEAVHAGCEWQHAGELREPAIATLGDVVVGLAMPIRDNPTESVARESLRAATYAVESAESTLAQADKIRAAVTDIEAVEAAAVVAAKDAQTARFRANIMRALANRATALDAAGKTLETAKRAIAEAESDLRSMGLTP